MSIGLLRQLWLASLVVLAACAADTTATGQFADQPLLTDVVLGHEELISACMSDAGFEYIAAVPNHAVVEQRHADHARAGRDPSEIDVEELMKQLPPDPNIAIMQSLSDLEQEQYGLIKQDCFWESYEAAWGVDPVELGQVFEQEAEETTNRLAVDPRTVSAEEEVLNCTADAGYTFKTVEDLVTFEARRTNETVTEINDAGRDVVRVDDPIWVAFQQEVDTFRAATSLCAEVFSEKMRVLSNEYFQPASGE